MSVEVAAVVVEPEQKSAASKEWQETLSHDAERKKRALARSETFKAEQPREDALPADVRPVRRARLAGGRDEPPLARQVHGDVGVCGE